MTWSLSKCSLKAENLMLDEPNRNKRIYLINLFPSINEKIWTKHWVKYYKGISGGSWFVISERSDSDPGYNSNFYFDIYWTKSKINQNAFIKIYWLFQVFSSLNIQK